MLTAISSIVMSLPEVIAGSFCALLVVVFAPFFIPFIAIVGIGWSVVWLLEKAFSGSKSNDKSEFDLKESVNTLERGLIAISNKMRTNQYPIPEHALFALIEKLSHSTDDISGYKWIKNAAPRTHKTGEPANFGFVVPDGKLSNEIRDELLRIGFVDDFFPLDSKGRVVSNSRRVFTSQWVV